MNRSTCFGTILLALLVCTASALALGSDYQKGQQVSSHPNDWPKGLKEVLEFQAHEGGYFVNANDFYWFSGDTQAINRFLIQSAKIDGAPVHIRFHSGKGEGKPPWPDKAAVPIDWQVSIFCRGWSRELPENAPTRYIVRIDVWDGGQVNRQAVEVPTGIVPMPEQLPATAPTTATSAGVASHLGKPGTGTVSGQIIDQRSDRSGLGVRIETSPAGRGRPLASSLTQEDGSFLISDVPAGQGLVLYLGKDMLAKDSVNVEPDKNTDVGLIPSIPQAAPTHAVLRTGDVPIGSLRFTLGTYLTIEGKRADGLKTGTQTLQIDTINGRKLDATVSIWVEDLELPAGVRCTLKGYETAG